jgi:hypothetical protein
MSGPEHPADGRGPAGEPTRFAPTDFLSRHEGAVGHGDGRDRAVREISRELNQRSDFLQELQRHAEQHRNRLPFPDGQAGSGSAPTPP